MDGVSLLESARVGGVREDGVEGTREVDRARLVEEVEAGAGEDAVNVRRVLLLVLAEDGELSDDGLREVGREAAGLERRGVEGRESLRVVGALEGCIGTR